MDVQTILDEVERRLHDPDNKIWARRELLDYLNEGYRDIMANGTIPSFAASESPGRWAYAASFPWEREHLRLSRAWLPFYAVADTETRPSYRWEIEWLDGRTPTNSLAAITQPWELAYGETDRPLPFLLPDDVTKMIRPSWDYKRLEGVTVKEIDATGYSWWSDTGLPQYFWNDGRGTKEFGIYPLEAGYNQAYQLSGDHPNGTPRTYSGSRTWQFSQSSPIVTQINGFTNSGEAENVGDFAWRFTLAATDTDKSFCTQNWEKNQLEEATLTAGKIVGIFDWEIEHGAANFPSSFILGTVRETTGSFQYLPQGKNSKGLLRYWAGWEDALGLIYARISLPLLAESESPDELPEKLHKYLRSYVCKKALSRQGPGQNFILAALYGTHYGAGLRLFKKMSMLMLRDWIPVRQEYEAEKRGRRPGRVQLPPEFPRVLV